MTFPNPPPNHLLHLPPTALPMDPLLWPSLPDELVYRILAWLPLSSKLACKCVSKCWRSLLSSDSHLNYGSNNHAQQPSWFLLCTLGGIACAFDPSLSSWLKLFKPVSPAASVVAAGGSFLCLGNQVSECRVLSVCNPMTKSLNALPKMARIGLIHKASMVVERATNAYVIVVTGEDGYSRGNPHVYELLTEVYDSLSGSWKMAGSPLPDVKFGTDPGVWCNGLFYSITELPYGLVAFDLRNGLWSAVPVQMPESIASPSLIDCQGQLLMVGREVDGSCKRPSTRRIKIWRFDFVTVEWKELEEMPERLCSEFLAPLGAHSPLVCAGVGDLICMTTHLSPHTAVYDTVAKLWRWLPSDPLFPKNRDFHLLGFCFRPTLDAVP